MTSKGFQLRKEGPKKAPVKAAPKPAGDDDAAPKASGSLASTGAADRPLAAAAGLLLLAGGLGVALGTGFRRRPAGLRA